MKADYTEVLKISYRTKNKTVDKTSAHLDMKNVINQPKKSYKILVIVF